MSLFKREDMRDKLLQIQDATTYAGNCWWPGVTVAVDEPEINLGESARNIHTTRTPVQLTSAREICINGRSVSYTHLTLPTICSV